MLPLGDGHWLKELELSPGTYEYQLIVDGAWIEDPRASETAPNPFGGTELRFEGRLMPGSVNHPSSVIRNSSDVVDGSIL
jgi:hypothetical protein